MIKEFTLTVKNNFVKIFYEIQKFYPSVTYTVSTVLMNMMAVDRRGRDIATVVIAVGVGTINLALGKPATQSSTFLYLLLIDVGAEVCFIRNTNLVVA
jgi:hypothetical protein